MTAPLVSVCIPTRNGEQWLERTLRSVLDQTHPNLRIVVSDDASTDGTLSLVERLRDDRFTVLTHDVPLGAAGNWNAACAEAEGDYVKLVCQDDILLPTCIEHQVGALEARPECSFCWSPRDVISPRGRRLVRARGLVPVEPVVGFDDVASGLVRGGTNPFGEPCAVLMRRSALAATTGFRGEYLIDLNMWIELLERGPAVHVDETLSQFRITTSSWTAVLADRQADQFEEFARALADSHPAAVSQDDVAHGSRCAARLQRRRRMLVAALKLLPV